MSAHYKNISLVEMRDFLENQGFKEIKDPSLGTEVIFGKRVDTNGKQLSLRVYTGIVGDESRSVGEDAIRVVLFVRVDGKPVKVSGDRRVHRVEGWKKNLQSRLDNVLLLLNREGRLHEDLPAYDCLECNRPLVIRRPKTKGAKYFVGCSGFPNCKYTQTI